MPGTGREARGTNHKSDVLTTFQFYVQIEGINEAVFQEMSGLEVTTEVTDLPEGGVNDHIHRLIGHTKVGDITLKNGVTISKVLWNWYKQVIQGPPWGGNSPRKNLSIVMVDQLNQEVQRWDLAYALPIKWTGPAFNAGTTAAAIQALVLTHKGLILR